jgi:hypothetical protein
VWHGVQNDGHADLAVMPTTDGIPLWRKGSRPDGVGITVARRGWLDHVPRELRVDTHTCNARTRAGQVLLCLTDRETAAQPDELRYADPSMAHPPTAQMIQHQGRHNRDVGMTVVMPTSALRRIPSDHVSLDAG